MSDLDHGIDGLPSLAGFSPVLEPDEQMWDEATSSFATLRNNRAGSAFGVRGRIVDVAAPDPASAASGRDERVLYIQDIQVAGGTRNLGSAVIAAVLAQARERGVHTAVMDLTASRALGIILKLTTLGIVTDSYFQEVEAGVPPTARAIIPLRDFASQPNLATPDRALELLLERETRASCGTPAAQLGSVACMIVFG